MSKTRSAATNSEAPVRPRLGVAESLDSYLERTAEANDITTAQIMKWLNPERDPSLTVFAMTQPSPGFVGRIHQLTNLDHQAIRDATLQRFRHNLPLDFSGFDRPRADTFRTIAARGWFPLHGSQTCPRCVVETGIWDVRWRLPYTTVCLTHGIYLVEECGKCGTRFRSRRHQFLRPFADSRCGNPQGPRQYCRQSLNDNDVSPAPPDVISVARKIDTALARNPATILGSTTSAEQYLAELRSMTVILLHIATRNPPGYFEQWATKLRKEAESRTSEHRGPRWGLRPPPDDPRVRGAFLAEADQILASTSTESASRKLDQWLAAVPGGAVGPKGWIRNRTTPSSIVADLINQTTAARQASTRRSPPRRIIELPDRAIPQQVPQELFESLVGTKLNTHDEIGRRFISLCLVKLGRQGRTWNDAADVLEIPKQRANRTVKTVFNRSSISAHELTVIIREFDESLGSDVDYRKLESKVRTICSDSDQWFRQWAALQRPPRRPQARPYAITWLWLHIAQGDPRSSPAWSEEPNRRRIDSYRRFETTLTAEAIDALRNIGREA